MAFLRSSCVACLVASLAGCGAADSDDTGRSDGPARDGVAGDGGGSGDGARTDAGATAACTAAGQGVTGASLEFSSYELLDLSGLECPTELFISVAHLAEAFPSSEVPPEVLDTDFGRDRVLVHTQNPGLQFAADDGAELVIGEELVCQGAFPSCMAHVIHGSTRNALDVVSCPYAGPDPCLAP
jgi:hypothetical protein